MIMNSVDLMSSQKPGHMTLNKVLSDVAVTDNETQILGLALDNRKVKAGYLFFACKGISVHGKKFIGKAIASGAVAIVLESDSAAEALSMSKQYADIPVIAVDGLSQQLGSIAAKYYGDPSSDMTVVGITGTNGKTSCTHLLAQCLNDEKNICGVLGTLGAGVWGDVQAISHTTPDAIEVQQWLSLMQQKNAAVVAMEVSSHGLDQGRVNACQFDVAVFTNLTRDHLDYHGDITSYGNSKLKLFTRPELTKVVVNLDDPYSYTIIDKLAQNVTVVGITAKQVSEIDGVSIIHASNITLSKHGLSFNVQSPWGGARLESTLFGEFNVSNLLTVLAVALLLGESLERVLEKIKTAKAPAGRLETFSAETMPLVVVDYAHTPDALVKVLQTLKQHTKGKLFVLFGCGGDRDQGKRAEMGALAEQIADVIYVTDDNPRTERSSDIIDDILKGIKNPNSVIVDANRASAIKNIISAANSQDDVVLIAGKGHEDYQIIGDKRFDFSDREIVAQIIREAA